MTKVQAPTKGIRPSLDGVPGQLVDAAPVDVFFGPRKLKTSPYDPLLLQLQRAGAGKFLKFDDLRARASLNARSKKLGIKIMFGEQDQTLWVTLAKVEMETGGVTEKQPSGPSNIDLVLRALNTRSTAGEIVSWMRSNGAPGIGISQVDSLLSTLARAGKIRLKKQRTGDDQPERWERVGVPA